MKRPEVLHIALSVGHTVNFLINSHNLSADTDNFSELECLGN